MAADFVKYAVIGFAVALLLSFAANWVNGQENRSAELQISRELQSGELVPIIGDYVSYEVTVKNTGSSVIEGQLLWVHFASAHGKTDSKAAFSIPALAPGASTRLHIGPFKMLESGEHCISLGVNRDGDLEAPNQVALNYLPNQCADSITSYAPALATLLPAGAVLALAGAIFLGWPLKRRA